VIIPFEQDASNETIGCKAYHLSRMWRAGLPVPAGFCVPWDCMATLGMADLNPELAGLGNTFAVRSSSVQEDTTQASFAGILISRLNVATASDVLNALSDIRQSALAPAVEGYAQRREVGQSLRVAAIVQTFIAAEASGVLFMRDPVTGAAHMVVEGSWGLGPGVVEGLVQPDRWVISRDGGVMESHIADKDIAIVPEPRGGTMQTAIDPSCRRRPCLSPELLQQLSHLASACERLFGSPQDIEWAVADNRVWLLQSRPITSK
jgi:pyruvate,water dikinase